MTLATSENIIYALEIKLKYQSPDDADGVYTRTKIGHCDFVHKCKSKKSFVRYDKNLKVWHYGSDYLIIYQADNIFLRDCVTVTITKFSADQLSQRRQEQNLVSQLQKDGKFRDYTISFANGEQLKVHKLILKLRS